VTDCSNLSDKIDWQAQAVVQSARLHPYIPGKPIEQLLREKGISTAVKLASNENPYGVPPKAVAAMQKAATQAHRYPDGNCSKLRKALATFHQVNENTLVLGNGSNEVLELIIRTFAGAGDDVVFSQRGFIVYALAAQAAGANPVAVAEADGLTHDLQAMAAAVNECTKLVCIANPNNPTGTMHDTASLQAFLDQLPRQVIVLLDEAYYEFVSDILGDTVHVLQHPGLIISRTFSKAYGLAGLRLGYAVMAPEIASLVNRFREPFNVNLLAQEAALAALDDQSWVMQHVQLMNEQRAVLEKALQQRGVLGGVSCGNFVLLKHEAAKELTEWLESRGVIPRPLAPYGMPDVLRISVGLDSENEVFLKTLDAFLVAVAA